MDEKPKTKSVPRYAYIVGSIAVALALVLLFQDRTTQTKNASPSPTVASSVVPTLPGDVQPLSITYKGVAGKNALELLKQNAQIETTGEGQNAFVTAINGYKPDIQKEYWAFYVNGKQAEVGAGSYMTQDNDTIEWKLEPIKPQ